MTGHRPESAPTRASRTSAPLIRVRVVHAMTVPFTIQLVGAPDTPPDRLEASADRAAARCKAWLDHVEAAFSPFRADSTVSRARRGDWSALLTDPDFAEVHMLVKQAEQLTGGRFSAMHAGVYDPTGLVKGWAVERAHVRFLMPLIRSGEVAAAALGGGGDIQTAVAHDSDFVWRIGVDDPFAAHADGTGRHFPTLRTISLRDGAVATSGVSRRGEHITRAMHDLAQATVIDDRLTFADMWATTALAAGERAFRDLLDRHGRGRVIAVLVHADRSVTELPGSDRSNGPAGADGQPTQSGGRVVPDSNGVVPSAGNIPLAGTVVRSPAASHQQTSSPDREPSRSLAS